MRENIRDELFLDVFNQANFKYTQKKISIWKSFFVVSTSRREFAYMAFKAQCSHKVGQNFILLERFLARPTPMFFASLGAFRALDMTIRTNSDFFITNRLAFHAAHDIHDCVPCWIGVVSKRVWRIDAGHFLGCVENPEKVCELGMCVCERERGVGLVRKWVLKPKSEKKNVFTRVHFVW